MCIRDRCCCASEAVKPEVWSLLVKSSFSYRIMSAPLVTINEHAEIYEALLLMEQHLSLIHI